MSLAKAKVLVERCLADPEIKRLYAAGDKLSSHQTKHDLQHAMEVVKLSLQLVTLIRSSGKIELSDWDEYVVIPLAAFLHDIGRAIDVDDHAAVGAKWAKEYLSRLTLEGDSEALPLEVINKICRIVACHRSSTVLKATNMDPSWAVVVIADKCVGDEERVRPIRALVLQFLTMFRLSWIPLRKGGVHDRVNFAIKHVEIASDADDLVLKLKIDSRVCAPSLVYQTYTDRFQACSKAATFLGFNFRLEFNGVRFGLVGETWKEVETGEKP